MLAVMESTTMASVRLLAGSATLPATVRLLIVAAVRLAKAAVVVVKVVVAEKVLRPVKI